MDYKVKDFSLSEEGKKKVEFAKDNMKVLSYIKELYSVDKPFRNLTIATCLHITKETAVLLEYLKELGGNIVACPSNPLSTKDDIAAYLAKHGIKIFAWSGMNNEEYEWALRRALDYYPDLIIDDGADLIVYSHRRNRINIIGATEETTTGVNRIRKLEYEGKLKYPVIAVNNAETKWDFDNVYGTGQSVIDGIMRATNIMIAGKIVVVAGYGHVGRGIASRARGMGARVVITEVDPIKALRAVMDGYEVMRMDDAIEIGDIFITATGCKDVITRKHFRKMKDGAILANAGHFNVEISVRDFERYSKEKKIFRNNLTMYEIFGKRLFLIADGRLVNLVAAEGNPSEVMDLSFSNQLLSLIYILKNKDRLENKVYEVPKEQDEFVARIKLKTMGIEIDELTKYQKKYLGKI